MDFDGLRCNSMQFGNMQWTSIGNAVGNVTLTRFVTFRHVVRSRASHSPVDGSAKVLVKDPERVPETVPETPFRDRLHIVSICLPVFQTFSRPFVQNPSNSYEIPII